MEWLEIWEALVGSQRRLGSFWCGSGGDEEVFSLETASENWER
jgi:hypothetical protein